MWRTKMVTIPASEVVVGDLVGSRDRVVADIVVTDGIRVLTIVDENGRFVRNSTRVADGLVYVRRKVEKTKEWDIGINATLRRTTGPMSDAVVLEALDNKIFADRRMLADALAELVAEDADDA